MRARGGTALALVVVGLAGCTGEPTDTAEETGSQTADRVAEQLMQVTSAHEATGGTLLEGPTIGEDGKLYVVDVMAPDVARATVTLLERLGHEVVFDRRQTCCGQMHTNSGYYTEEQVESGQL